MKKDFAAATKLPSLPVTRSVNRGVVEWHNEFHELHREDGPARELPNGNRAWHLFGKMHRVGGPAFEQPDGARLWCLHGEFHREDGPAVESPSGYSEWWIHGKKLSAAEIADVLAAQEQARLAVERKGISEEAALAVREGVASNIPLKSPLRFRKP